MLRSLHPCIAISRLLVAAQPALAQKTGPNGGLLAGKGGHQTELVVIRHRAYGLHPRRRKAA